MKEGTSPEVLKARESRGEPRVGRVRGSGPCRGVIERPGGSRHDSCPSLRAEPRRGKAPVRWSSSEAWLVGMAKEIAAGEESKIRTRKKISPS